MVLTAADLAVREVTVSFGGITALDGVSVEVSTGEVVGVIGPNGAGKTTLFNVICGFVVARFGHARLARARSLHGLRPDRLASFGDRPDAAGRRAVPAADRARERDGGRRPVPPLPLRRRAARAVDVGPRRAAAARRARATLARLDCEGIDDRLPGTLPYAVQKRVALARALVCEPELLLLDEPAGGLGADELSELGELIRSLGQSIAVMVVEHHMDLVMSVCDRVVVLDFGRVIASGEPGRDPGGPAGARGLPRPRRRGRAEAGGERGGRSDADG